MDSVPYIFGIAFNICSFLFYLLLVIVYFRKNAKYNLRNYIFRRILYFGFFGFLFEFLYLFIIHFSNASLLVGLSKKFVFLCFLACLLLWTYYVILVAFEKNQEVSNKIRKSNFSIDIFLLVLLSVIGIIDLLLPCSFEYSDVGRVLYMYGIGTSFIYFIYIFLSVVPIPFLLMNYKDITFKGLFPYYFILTVEMISFIILHFVPSLCLLGFVYTIGCYVIYYRMENPDIFLIRKFKKNSDRMRLMKEKYGFLFNMSPELRDLLNEISYMKDNYLIDGKKAINKKKFEALMLDFVTSGEMGKTVQNKVDDDGIEILDLDDEKDPNEEMLVTKEIYSLKEIKEILKEDNLPRW